MSDYRVDFATMAWDTPMSGLRFRARRLGNRQLRLVEYTRDMEPHWCDKGHIGYVLQGKFEIRFPTDVVVFNTGDGIFIPPGTDHRHMGKVLTDLVRVVFVEEV